MTADSELVNAHRAEILCFDNISEQQVSRMSVGAGADSCFIPHLHSNPTCSRTAIWHSSLSPHRIHALVLPAKGPLSG
jgi:hypothetical protein